MFELKTWLSDQGLTVTELARLIGTPRTTVEDWVYKGAVPKAENLDTLNNFIAAVCPHHWVIERSNGPESEGVCQRCWERRDFSNSVDTPSWPINQRNGAYQRS